jgi:energy-coupling factor transporter ATP-binding protein EcfA2
MLTAHHITKSYGIQPILQDVSFSINPGDRLGLIGPNGCGKSTLLRILIGQEGPDSGSVAHTRPGLRIGYLAQGLDIDPALTVAEACAPASSKDVEGDLARVAAALAAHPTDGTLQAEYGDLLGQLSTVPPKPSLLRLVWLTFPPKNASANSPADRKPVSCWRACCSPSPTCSCWMNPPTTSTSACWNGWKTGWQPSLAQP